MSQNSSQYLYVAREAGQNQPVWKVGQTLRAPMSRVKELGGQTGRKFELIAQFETQAAKLAESLAHEALDELGAREYPHTRIELFRAPLAVVRRCCAEAVQTANRERALQTRPTGRATSGVSATPHFRATSAVWSRILAAPVTLDGRTVALKCLLEAAEARPELVRRAARLGVYRLAYRLKETDYRVEWSEAHWLVKYCRAVGLTERHLSAGHFKLLHVSQVSS